MLSKNLDAKVLSNVEILEGFEDNPVLAKVLNSNKVAINLVLKEEFKNIWFGNAGMGFGTEDRVKLASNLGLIRKKIKFFNFNNYTNLGQFAKEQVVTGKVEINNAFDEKKELPEINPIYEVPDYQLSFFKDNEDVFNKAFINALSFVKSIKPSLRVRGTGYFSNDIGKQLVSSKTVFNTLASPITYTESKKLTGNESTMGGEIELKYNDEEKSYLKNVFIFKHAPVQTDQHIIFNDSLVKERQHQKSTTFFNHLDYSILLGNRNILHNYFYFGGNYLHQNIDLNSPGINEIFSQAENEFVNTKSMDNATVFGGKSSVLITTTKLENNIELEYEKHVEKRASKFLLDDSETRIDSLENHLKYYRQTLQVNNKLNYKLSNKVEVFGGLAMVYLDARTNYSAENHFFLNPKIGFRLRNLGIGTFSLQYTRDYVWPYSDFFLENYQLSGYQSFVKGTNEIKFIHRNKYRLAYDLSNNLHTQSFSVRLLYTKANGRYSTDNSILDNLSFTAFQFVNTGDSFVAKIDLTSYFKELNLSTRLGTLQNLSTTLISINANQLEKLNLNTATYFLSGRTYFNIPVNFDFNFNLINNKTVYKNTESKSTWKSMAVEANITLSKVVTAQVNSKFYYLTQDNYNFVNVHVNHTPEKSKLSYQLILNNIMNENRFTLDNVNEISTYQQTTRLLPRYIFAAIKYRF